MADFWKNKVVVVTGGTGFLGQALQKFMPASVKKSHYLGRKKYDLTCKLDACDLYHDLKPDILINLAANVGGIGYNKKHPATLFYDNFMIGVNLIAAGVEYGSLSKFVQIGTVCSYPKYTTTPFSELDFWKGYPEETNAPYGVAKKALLVMLKAYEDQYRFPACYLVLANLYGPNDNFDPSSSHVIPALIKKFIDAVKTKQEVVTLWGTGKATREFLYVEDAAKAIIKATEKVTGTFPVNIGTGKEHTIEHIAAVVSQLCGYKGIIDWDKINPDGQPRRNLDIRLAQKLLNLKTNTPLLTGLKRTIAYYEKEILHSN